MSRFVFRLQTVLRLRQRSEDEARRELGRRVGQLDAQKQKLSELSLEIQEVSNAQNAARSGDVWAEGQMLFLGWRSGQLVKIQEQLLVIKEAEAQVEQARQALLEARRAVQVLEKLRERRLEQWKLAERRKEQATLSDIAAQRWMRQQEAAQGA
jgi:flagellar FliJ protein